MTSRDEIVWRLREEILAALHLGTLAAGDRLPSTRATAVRFGVALRTSVAAYRMLEAEGIVELRERSGIFVARGEPAAHAMLPQLSTWVVDVLVQAVGRGIPPREFPERVRRCLETLRLRAACIECNEDQMHSICTELANDYGFESRPVDLERFEQGDAEATSAVRTADLLVTTAAHAAAVHRMAAQVKLPSIVISLRAEIVEELRRLIAAGPVYFIATDARFRDALAELLLPTGDAGHVHVLVLGRDDLGVIPDGAPTYVTASARDRGGRSGHAGSVIQTPRVLSPESARELLTFVVYRNLAAMQGRAAT